VSQLIPVELIEKRILLIRSQKVMLDAKVVANCDHLSRLKLAKAERLSFWANL